jgi:hypothetical protein
LNEHLWVIGRHQEAGFTLPNCLYRTTAASSDYRKATGTGFQVHDAKTFHAGPPLFFADRHDKDVGIAVNLGQFLLGYAAQKIHGMSNAHIAGHLFETRPVWTIASYAITHIWKSDKQIR